MTATAALERWRDDTFAAEVRRKADVLTAGLDELAGRMAPGTARTVGRGLMQGLELDDEDLAAQVAAAAFERGVLVETAGADDQVVKLLPPLTISDDDLAHAFEVLGAGPGRSRRRPATTSCSNCRARDPRGHPPTETRGAHR